MMIRAKYILLKMLRLVTIAQGILYSQLKNTEHN